MFFIPEYVGELKDKVVLVVWGPGTSGDDLKRFSEDLSSQQCSVVIVENAERLSMSSHPSSSFDLVLSNLLQPCSVSHTFDLLSEIIKILKPNGLLCGVEKDDGTAKQLATNLQLSGFSKTTQKQDSGILHFSAQKPSFEIGSSSKLSFGNGAAWSLTDTIDNEVELIDEDDLLDDDDLIKPQAESLKVCGTTGKRKACKDCSCGLAEELAMEGEKTVNTKVATSSCGSCYLGDAFRCASCPYLGMPAFKPGEKIKLSDRQLNADV